MQQASAPAPSDGITASVVSHGQGPEVDRLLADLAALGVPSERAYLEQYCARTGRDIGRALPHWERGQRAVLAQFDAGRWSLLRHEMTALRNSLGG